MPKAKDDIGLAEIFGLAVLATGVIGFVRAFRVGSNVVLMWNAIFFYVIPFSWWYVAESKVLSGKAGPVVMFAFFSIMHWVYSASMIYGLQIHPRDLEKIYRESRFSQKEYLKMLFYMILIAFISGSLIELLLVIKETW